MIARREAEHSGERVGANRNLAGTPADRCGEYASSRHVDARAYMPVRTTLDPACAPRPSLPLARYRVRFRERIPEGGFSLASPRAGYLGSAWRGAFGHALRKTVCVTRLPACDPCVLLRSCPYPFLFESRTPPGATKLTRYPRTPGPCVLEPADRRFDTENSTLHLGVTLFGPANDHLPYVVHALDVDCSGASRCSRTSSARARSRRTSPACCGPPPRCP